MEINNSITVPLSIDDAWVTLTDLERIVPCMPGAKITGRDGEDYLGTIRVKVGPITSTYSGVARFVRQDPETYEATIEAEGRDTKSAGTAKALVHASLASGSGSTTVTIITELTITGKIAQIGQGVIADVSGKLMDQFSRNLTSQLEVPGLGETHAPADRPYEGEAVLDLGKIALPKLQTRAIGLILLVLLVVSLRQWRVQNSSR